MLPGVPTQETFRLLFKSILEDRDVDAFMDCWAGDNDVTMWGLASRFRCRTERIPSARAASTRATPRCPGASSRAAPRSRPPERPPRGGPSAPCRRRDAASRRRLRRPPPPRNRRERVVRSPPAHASSQATSTWWFASTSASAASSDGRRTVFAPPNRSRRDRGPSRSNTDCTTSVSPLRSGRTVIPRMSSVLMGRTMPVRHGPSHRLDGPSSRMARAGHYPWRHGAGDPLPRLRRSAPRVLDVRRGAADRRRAALGLAPRRGVGRPGPAVVLRELGADAPRHALRPDRLRALVRELEPRPTVESESRQLEAVIDAAGGRAVVFASSCCCLTASQLAVRRPDAGRRDRLLRRLRVAQRHPRGDARSLIEFIRDELDARRADARRPLRPARERRRDRRATPASSARPRLPRPRRSSSSSNWSPTSATSCRT